MRAGRYRDITPISDPTGQGPLAETNAHAPTIGRARARVKGHAADTTPALGVEFRQAGIARPSVEEPQPPRRSDRGFCGRLSSAVQRCRFGLVVPLQLLDLAVTPTLVHEERRRSGRFLGSRRLAP